MTASSHAFRDSRQRRQKGKYTVTCHHMRPSTLWPTRPGRGSGPLSGGSHLPRADGDRYGRIVAFCKAKGSHVGPAHGLMVQAGEVVDSRQYSGGALRTQPVSGRRGTGPATGPGSSPCHQMTPEAVGRLRNEEMAPFAARRLWGPELHMPLLGRSALS